ncbi:hypothetical protein AURDEDRAFT_130825 [Auricularia subglabra TFB-10046 SS5]|nr:hypothetical protein AURDEDRAFT_130825 [Auricularia subglabra TFB-10046 SS5]
MPRPALPLLDDDYFSNDLHHCQYFYSHFTLHVPHDPPLPPLNYPTHPRPIPLNYLNSGLLIPLELVPRGPIDVALYLATGDPRPGRVADALRPALQNPAPHPQAAQQPIPHAGHPGQHGAVRGHNAPRPGPGAARDQYGGLANDAHATPPPPPPLPPHDVRLHDAARHHALNPARALRFERAQQLPPGHDLPAGPQPVRPPPAGAHPALQQPAHPPARLVQDHQGALPPAPPRAAAPAIPPPQVEADFNVLVPTATHGANGVVNTTIIAASDIVPAELFNKICAALKVHPTAAQLAYKVSNQRDTPKALPNANDMDLAIKNFLACRRRSHLANRASVELRIINLTLLIQAQRSAKRSSATVNLDGDPEDAAYDFPDVPGYPAALKKLKVALICVDAVCNPRQEKGHWCFRNQHGVLVCVSLRFITLWAKFMALDPEAVTPERLPNSKAFEFLQQCKRAPRGQQNAPTGAAVPGATINIHNDFGFLRDVFRPSKRVNTGAAYEDAGADLVADDECSSTTGGTPVSAADSSAHDIVAFLAVLDSKQPGQNLAQYGPDLAANGICLPVHLLTVEQSMFVDLLGIPAGAVKAMVDHAKHLLGPQTLLGSTSTPSPSPASHRRSGSTNQKASSSRVTLEKFDKDNWAF